MAYQAILFDYDGVLADSEPTGLRILRSMLAKQGWKLGPLRCRELFMGQPQSAWAQIIETESGIQIEKEWLTAYQLKHDQAMRRGITPVPGIGAALQQIHNRWPGRMACVSAASQKKLDEQLHTLGFHHYFSPHIYSGQDTPRNKPHPDVYLKAIASLGQDIMAAQCAVIEDSIIGIQAAVAAGTQVLAYTAGIEPQRALAAGARLVFEDMNQLPGLLAKEPQIEL